MFSSVYKKLVIDFPKVILLFLAILIGFSFYHAKNFNLDASSDALLLEGDPDLKYLREVNETYGSKDFLVLTYTPVSSFIEKETILNLQLLKSKIEKLTWVDSVTTVIDVPLLKSTDESLMNRLKNYKTLAHPEIDRKRGFEEIVNSPISKTVYILFILKEFIIGIVIVSFHSILTSCNKRSYPLNKLTRILIESPI